MKNIDTVFYIARLSATLNNRSNHVFPSDEEKIAFDPLLKRKLLSVLKAMVTPVLLLLVISTLISGRKFKPDNDPGSGRPYDENYPIDEELDFDPGNTLEDSPYDPDFATDSQYDPGSV